jgi:hypothetical protein
MTTLQMARSNNSRDIPSPLKATRHFLIATASVLKPTWIYRPIELGKNFHLRVSMRPTLWDIRAAASSEKVVLKVEDHGVAWQKILSFSELRNPEALLADFDKTSVLSLLVGAGLMPSK